MENTDTPSDTPQLNEIAATVLAGLLASGDYTDGPESFQPYTGERQKPRSRYRQEAVNDAVELTLKLKKALQTVGLLPAEAPKPVPESPPAAQD
jgi:hypothetical protein